MSEQDNPKTLANRRNAQHSTGPKDTTETRLNAVQHGLLAQGITELDDAHQFEQRLAILRAELAPVGTLEGFLVDRIALGLVRLQRAALLEADAITAALHPPRYLEDVLIEGETVDAGLPARLSVLDAQQICDIFQRYETANENKLYRAMHQLERLQRIRKGESVPAPAALDVGVTVASFGKEGVEKE